MTDKNKAIQVGSVDEVEEQADRNTIGDRTATDVTENSPAGNPDSEIGRGDGSGDTEIGGRKGLEPTRYGDWEKDGRCIDF